MTKKHGKRAADKEEIEDIGIDEPEDLHPAIAEEMEREVFTELQEMLISDKSNDFKINVWFIKCTRCGFYAGTKPERADEDRIRLEKKHHEIIFEKRKMTPMEIMLDAYCFTEVMSNVQKCIPKEDMEH